MGASGLLTYVVENKQLFSRDISKNGKPCKVILDGSSFYFQIYYSMGYRGFQHVFSYSRIESFLTRIFKCLKKNNVELEAIIFDGMSDVDKMSTYQSRRNEKMKLVQKAYDSSFMGRHHPSMILWFRYTLFKIVNKLYDNNISIFFSGVDGDRDIAKFAADHHLAIISNDGDMFVMSEYGVILLNDCIHQNNSLLLYHRKLFIDHFQITLNHLIYLSILTGNDFIKATSLRRVLNIQEEKQTFSHSLIYITEHIRKKATYKEIENDFCKLHSQMENPRELFIRVYKKYDVTKYPPFPYSLFVGIESEASLKDSVGFSESDFVDFLNQFDYSVSTRIIDMLFTPVIHFSIFLTSPYQEQLQEIQQGYLHRICKLIGNGKINPYVACGTHNLIFYPSEDSFNEMINKRDFKWKTHMKVVKKLRHMSYHSRVQYLLMLSPISTCLKHDMSIFLRSFFSMIEAFLLVIFPKEKVVLVMNILYDMQAKRQIIHKKHKNKKTTYSDELFRDTISILDIICVSYILISVICNILNITTNTSLLDNFCLYCIMNEYNERTYKNSVAEEVTEM